MQYHQVQKGIFLDRPNRFLANIEIEGKVTSCHVKNTGRCQELFRPGVTVILEQSDHQNRKTKYDVIGVYKGTRLINVDSQAPNQVVGEWLAQGSLIGKPTYLKPEAKYGNSRFDMYMEAADKKIFMEVKGVTLEENGIVRFPDAPTQRGIKHIMELCRCVEEGYEAYLCFVIQMHQVTCFRPNDTTHKAFGDALRHGAEQGVHILAYDCIVGEASMVLNEAVPIEL